MRNIFLITALILVTISTLYPQSDSVRYELKPVVVTATRISEAWLEVPLALSIVEAKDLQQVRGYGLDEALSNIPGVMVQSRYGNQDVRLTVRGFGARGAGERSNAGTSRGIRVLLDGFPETEPDGRTSFDLIEISSAERIEVIRSNASALWGNASGGVVNFISNTSFKNPFINLQSTFGSFGYRKELLNLGTNIGSGKFFLTFSNTNYDGWREHSSSTRALLNTGIHSSIGQNTTIGIYMTAASNFFRIPGPLTQAQFNENPQQGQNDTSNYKPTYVQRDERRLNRLGRMGIKFSHDIDNHSGITALVFVTPKVLQRSERNTFRDFNRYHIGGNIVYRNSFIINSDLKNTLLLGLDEAYQDGSILFYNLVNGQRGTTLSTNKREGANNFGIFAQNEFFIGDHFSLIFGARYDNITYYSDNNIKPNLNASRSFKQITPKAGVSYLFSPPHSIYANLGGGVEVPAGNEVDPPSTTGQDTVTSLNPLLDPIRSTTYEIGTKQILTFGKSPILKSLLYDLSVYLIEIKNDLIPYRDGRFYFTAGKTRRIGGELGFTIISDYGVTLKSALTYSQNKYVEYMIDSVHYNKADKFEDLKDNKMAGVPDIFYRTSFKYAPTFFQNIFCELTIQGVGDYYADDSNTLTVPAYNVINLTLGFEDLKLISDKLVIRGFVGINNLTDKKYAASAFINPDVDRISKQYPIFLEPGLPMNYVGSISVNWNF